jgi:hypothetical protein
MWRERGHGVNDPFELFRSRRFEGLCVVLQRRVQELLKLVRLQVFDALGRRFGLSEAVVGWCPSRAVLHP